MSFIKDKNVAIEQAKVNSTVYNDSYFVIFSNGLYYVEKDSFTRANELMICKVENGEVEFYNGEDEKN